MDRPRDDGIIPGCYVLDIGIPSLKFTSRWIRADYIRIYDSMMNLSNLSVKYQVPCSSDNQASASLPLSLHQHSTHVCAIRQDYYAARRCAAETGPFIRFRNTNHYLFVK